MGLIAGGGDALENLNEIRRAMRGLLGSTDPEKVAEYEGLKLLYGIDNPESQGWSAQDWTNWETKLKYLGDTAESERMASFSAHSPGLSIPARMEEAGEVVRQLWDAYPRGETPGSGDPEKVEALYRLYESGYSDLDPVKLRNRFFDQLTENRDGYEMASMWPPGPARDNEQREWLYGQAFVGSDLRDQIWADHFDAVNAKRQEALLSGNPMSSEEWLRLLGTGDHDGGTPF